MELFVQICRLRLFLLLHIRVVMTLVGKLYVLKWFPGDNLIPIVMFLSIRIVVLKENFFCYILKGYDLLNRL